MDFSKFNVAVNAQLALIMQTGSVFEAKINGHALSELYLASFPEGTNPIFRERTEHDCSCCKHFIRTVGRMLGVVNGKLTSIWDIDIDEPAYQAVADALHKAVVESGISNKFIAPERVYGGLPSKDATLDVVWDHFYVKLPAGLYNVGGSIASIKGRNTSFVNVFRRSVTEITQDAIDLVDELISQNAIYRGQEHKSTVSLLKKLRKGYDKAADKEVYLWTKYLSEGPKVAVRNTVIGTLLTDLSEGVELEKAVKSFETKVAPQNYKRPTALITKGMIEKAQKKVQELGIEESLYRRYAVESDLTINNVLFADRKVQPAMSGGIFEDLKPTKTSKPDFDRLDEIAIDDFIKNYLPKAESLELFVENKHESNLMSVIAPQTESAASLFKWNNSFSWAYNGDVADSDIKERVKKAGGNVDAYLRVSLSWFNGDDLDIHAKGPNGSHIYFGNKRGVLDVDMNAGGPNNSTDPVENLSWTSPSKIAKGVHTISVRNYSQRGRENVGFEIEVEYNGEIYRKSFPKGLRDGEKQDVLSFTVDADKNVTFNEKMEGSTTQKDVWGVLTNSFVPVKMVMNSPNHWNGEETGNKHTFFILDKCANPEGTRGFYNEFLRGDLDEHRKVFEVLGNKTRVTESEHQLSGLGFSSTQRNHVVCKVSGKFNRVIKIKF